MRQMEATPLRDHRIPSMEKFEDRPMSPVFELLGELDIALQSHKRFKLPWTRKKQPIYFNSRSTFF